MNVWGDSADAASVLSVQETSADALQDDQLGDGIGEYDWLTTPSPRFTPDANAVMGSSFREVLQSQLMTESELTESGSGAGQDAERIELGEWSVGMAKDANARASSTWEKMVLLVVSWPVVNTYTSMKGNIVSILWYVLPS